MSASPFATVLGVHAILLGVLGVLWLCSPARGSPLVLALVALFFNAVPVSPIVGLAAPIYLQDLAVPLALGLTLWRGPPVGDPLLLLVALAAFLWPALGTLVGLVENVRPLLGENAQFLYRRLAFVLYFGAGLSGVLRRGQLRQVLDAALVIWVGMSIAGVLQYAGVLETDLWRWLEVDPGDADAGDVLPMTRGFMGLNRGAVGVWGSAAASYAFTMLAVAPRRSALRILGYAVAAALSTGAILLSGSRTGLVAAAAGVAFAGARLAGAGRIGAATRIVLPVAAIAAAVAVTSSDGRLDAITGRFAPASSGYGTGQQRADVQRQTASFVLGDPRALTIGMGHSVAEFRRHVGDRFDLSHSHSEYVEVLYEAGLPGLLLYLALLGALFVRLRPTPGGPDVVSAARPVLIAGMVAGAAVGHFFITSARLAPFGLLMAFVYGAYVHEADAARGGAPEQALPGARARREPWRWAW